MSKRSWHEANQASPSARAAPPPLAPASSVSPATYHSPPHSISPSSVRNSIDDHGNAKVAPRAQKAGSGVVKDESSKMPGISRKVKACAACRKQKIKCIMTGDPPCQRCKERGLSCRLNKSLQTLMSEDSRWKSCITKDVAAMYTSIDQVLQLLQLPSLPTMQTSTQDPAIYFEQADADKDDDDDEQSPDNSPKITPVTDGLAHVPIESLYQITGLRSLKAAEGITEEQSRICKQLRDTDFIARGIVKVEDGEELAKFYLKKLDPHIYHLAGEYTDLESFRSRSPTLTACVLTVAALHDTERSSLYATCSKEYRRLVANAMFERKIDMEYLRALVIGSYWLSDISWTLSGYAIRRASEFHLRQCYHTIADAVRSPADIDRAKVQSAMDGLRVLYLLYICDHHLSILYGRTSIMRDNENYITGWENYLNSPVGTDSDRRITGQICLLYLMNQMREALGPEDTTTMLPAAASTKIANFERDLDDWIARFSRHNPNKNIGNWPNKGAILHYHWAKLYLDSYVLRGLPEHHAVIPDHFLETASAAVQAAISIITIWLEDHDAQVAVAFVPHHIHGMIAFACMFLLKVATQHSQQLFVDMTRLRTLISNLAMQFKVVDVGKDHLIHRMADGLEKMAETLGGKPRQKREQHTAAVARPPLQANGSEYTNGVRSVVEGQNDVSTLDAVDTSAFDFNDPAMGLGMPFFDFEGTLSASENIWNFMS